MAADCGRGGGWLELRATVPTNHPAVAQITTALPRLWRGPRFQQSKVERAHRRVLVMRAQSARSTAEDFRERVAHEHKIVVEVSFLQLTAETAAP